MKLDQVKIQVVILSKSHILFAAHSLYLTKAIEPEVVLSSKNCSDAAVSEIDGKPVV